MLDDLEVVVRHSHFPRHHLKIVAGHGPGDRYARVPVERG